MTDSGAAGGEGDHDTKAKAVRALILVPQLRKRERNENTGAARDLEGKVEEAAALAKAIDLEVVDAFAVPISNYNAGTLFGSGKVEELRLQVELEMVGLVVVDHPLSPVQQRNLEKAWKTKVIDRTGLILEIFGERAQTREGRLQVELAHLTYQRSRLVRSWTHLERQRGGFGFLGGPGETQIEADRRLIQERIDRIERDLESVSRTRRLQRDNRRRSELPVVALVGYTNAGKTTLFNRLTESQQVAKDLLFATLDPTLRRLTLPEGTPIVLSDTVGFVANLPTDLVAAFRATLEEVVEADLILHVRDAAHPESAAQAADVAAVLRQLGIDMNDHAVVLDVFNKIDLVRDRGGNEMFSADHPTDGASSVAISALTGEGVPELLSAIETRLTAKRQVFRVPLSGGRLALLHRLYEFGEVLSREDLPDGMTTAIVRVAPRLLATFQATFPDAERQS